MRIKNIKVTTTHGFYDTNITEYLGPVTAHVVVGMNIFKDYLVGWTDVLGGKSKTYQNILSSINSEVIKKLKKKAFDLGGNCILNLKIDNDEISAQNKSMMMVSAIGTVAIADFKIKKKLSLNVSSQKVTRINLNQFKVLEQKEKYLKQIENNEIQVDNKFWLFAKENAIIEFSEYILKFYLKRLSDSIEFPSDKKQNLITNVEEYFSWIDTYFAIEFLYSKLTEKFSAEEKVEILNLIQKNNLISYNKIIDLMLNDDFFIKKIALKLSISEKEIYTQSDIDLINILINKVSTVFTERGEKTTKKKIVII